MNLGPTRFSWLRRWTIGIAGALPIGLLGIALVLEPSPLGLGTHQQLGLPPCSVRVLAGIRCPACGMTTSWSHAVRGHWIQAARASASGTVLAGVAVIAGPWLVVSACLGRWWIGLPADWLVVAGCVAIMILILTEWLGRLLISGN